MDLNEINKLISDVLTGFAATFGGRTNLFILFVIFNFLIIPSDNSGEVKELRDEIQRLKKRNGLK